MLAWWAGSRNWVSRYLGKNVYSPAMGRMCKTLLAVRNMRISFFSNRLTAFGKSREKWVKNEKKKPSQKFGSLEKRQRNDNSWLIYCFFLIFYVLFFIFLPFRLGFLESSILVGDRLVGNRLGNANMAMLTSMSIAEIRTRPGDRTFLVFIILSKFLMSLKIYN